MGSIETSMPVASLICVGLMLPGRSRHGWPFPETSKIVQEAEGYKKEVVAQAEGEASRFIAIYNEYAKAKTVTQERMYLETMEKVLSGVNKIIIDKQSGSGVVPYLPLPELKKNLMIEQKKSEVKN